MFTGCEQFLTSFNLFHPWARNCNTNNVVLQCINNVCYVCFICLLSMFNTVCDQFVTYFQVADPWSSNFQHNVKDEHRVCCKADDWLILFFSWKISTLSGEKRNIHKHTKAEQLPNCLTGSSLRFVCLLSMFTGCEEFLMSFKLVSSVSKKLQRNVNRVHPSLNTMGTKLILLYLKDISNHNLCSKI